MNDQIKNRLREIVAEAQMRVNQIATGYKVQLIEAERSEQEIRADVGRALLERQDAGMGASNYNFPNAPLTLDGVSKSDKELIEKAVEDMRAVEDLQQ